MPFKTHYGYFLLIRDGIKVKADPRLSRDFSMGFIESSVVSILGKNAVLKRASIYIHPVTTPSDLTRALSKALKLGVHLVGDFNDNAATTGSPAQIHSLGRIVNGWYDHKPTHSELIPLFPCAPTFQKPSGGVTRSSIIDGCFFSSDSPVY